MKRRVLETGKMLIRGNLLPRTEKTQDMSERPIYYLLMKNKARTGTQSEEKFAISGSKVRREIK